jgi:hypothetical protein
MQERNPWARAIRETVRTHMLGEPNIKNVQLNILSGEGQYCAPAVDEIAGFIPDGNTSFDSLRSVRLNNVGGGFSCIN